MLTTVQVLGLCDALGELGIHYWVVGGWGVDALLGRETRSHKDLDVLVLLDDLPRLRRMFAAMGFALSFAWEESHTIETEGDSWPTAFVAADASGRLIDVHLVGFEAGRLVQHYEHHWPLPQPFAGTGTIAGQEIPCATLEAQLAMHAGYDLPEAHRADVDLLQALRVVRAASDGETQH